MVAALFAPPTCSNSPPQTLLGGVYLFALEEERDAHIKCDRRGKGKVLSVMSNGIGEECKRCRGGLQVDPVLRYKAFSIEQQTHRTNP